MGLRGGGGGGLKKRGKKIRVQLFIIISEKLNFDSNTFTYDVVK